MEWWETFFEETYVAAWESAQYFAQTAEQAAAIERLLGLEQDR